MPRATFTLKRLLAVLALACLTALAPAARRPAGADDAPAPAQACREGTWVSYRVTAAPERLYFVPLPEGDPATPPPQEFSCRFTLRRHEGGKALFALSIAQNGLPPLEELLIENFPLERLTAPEALGRNVEVTSGQPAEFVIPAAAGQAEETIAATKVTLNGAGQKLEVWKSPAVPFGILRVACDGFQLSLTGYGW